MLDDQPLGEYPELNLLYVDTHWAARTLMHANVMERLHLLGQYTPTHHW